MNIPARHAWSLGLLLPGLSAVGFWILRERHLWQAPQRRALFWAVAAVGVHALLGLGLWKRNSLLPKSALGSGLAFLALRFLAGAALFVTGFVFSPGAEKVFATAWTGIFLILTVSESIYFVQGVQEL